MTPEEQDLASRFYEAVQRQSNYSERSQQSAGFRMGMSDLGWCSEAARRMLAGIPEPITDKLDAFLGTAIGDHVEAAFKQAYQSAIRGARVEIKFQGDYGEYTVSGHPDLILPDEGVLVDVKTKRGLAVPAKTGPSQQQQFQRHGYAKGAHAAGYFGDMPLERVQVANVWFDRAGDDEYCHVQMEPYSEDVIYQAGQWLDEVVHAYLNGEGARKEPPRDVCAKVCGHFADCRAYDTDAQGLIDDPEALAAIDTYREGAALESEGRKLKDQAKPYLKGRAGSTGDMNLRWVWINETLVPEYHRAGYFKIDLRPIK